MYRTDNYSALKCLCVSDIASVASVCGGAARLPSFLLASSKSLHLAEKFFQQAHAAVHVFLLQQERRQESEHDLRRAVEQYARRHRFIDDRARRDRELKRLDEATAPRLFCDSEFLHDQIQLVAQVCSDAVDLVEETVVLDHSQKFERDAAGERSTAECGAVLAGSHYGCERLLRDERSQRQPAGNRLRHHHHVRNNPRLLKGEHAAGAAEAALDLVEDEHGVVAVGGGARFL